MDVAARDTAAQPEPETPDIDRRTILPVSELQLPPTSATVRCFGQERLDVLMDYMIQNVLEPRNKAVRDGSCSRPPDATMLQIPCRQYSPTPVPAGYSDPSELPEHECPHPDDYIFCESKIWFIDLVETYNIALECPECKAAGRVATNMVADCWSHQAAPAAGCAGSWLVADRHNMLNFATARVRVCRSCKDAKPINDLHPAVWEQLPAHVLLDLPFTLTALVNDNRVLLHKNLERQLLFHVANGGCFSKFAEWVQSDSACLDMLHAAKYYADVAAWQVDMSLHCRDAAPHLPYFAVEQEMIQARTGGFQWSYQNLIAAFERAVQPLLCLLENVPLATVNGDSSMPMVGIDFANAPTDEGLVDLGLDHNGRTAKKCKKLFVWNVTNSKTKELLYQLFTDSTAMSSWIPHLQALAATPFLCGRIGVIWVDNHPLTMPEGLPENNMVEQIQMVTACKWVRQDPWHVMNRVLSKANNR